MRQGVPYAGADLTFYEECMRTIPAIALMKAQGRQADVLGALSALHANGTDLKVEVTRRWSILASAYMSWTQQLFEANADHMGEPREQMLQRAVASATKWAADA